MPATDRSLRWIAVESPLGTVVGAVSTDGLAAVRIGRSPEVVLDELRRERPAARLEPDDGGELEGLAAALSDLAVGRSADVPVPLDLGGTTFQRAVWSALGTIPRGGTLSYAQLALAIGAPSSVRAAASACAANPTALVVPCHRVVRSDGGLGGYRWGTDVKRRLLDLERRHDRGA